MATHPRTTASPRSEAFNHRLHGYSTIGAAALATAVVAGSNAANAQTITNVTAGTLGGTLPMATPGHMATFTINGNQFVFDVRSYNHQWSAYSASHSGGAQIEAAGRILNPGAAHGFAKSATIGPGHFNSVGSPGRLASSHSGGASGMIAPVGGNGQATGYVGIRLFNNATHYYGWLRVKVTNDGRGYLHSISLLADGNGVAGAFAAVPNSSILAGQEATAVPEPAMVAGGLALFALGAVGVRELRRRRSVARTTMTAAT